MEEERKIQSISRDVVVHRILPFLGQSPNKKDQQDEEIEAKLIHWVISNLYTPRKELISEACRMKMRQVANDEIEFDTTLGQWLLKWNKVSNGLIVWYMICNGLTEIPFSFIEKWDTKTDSFRNYISILLQVNRMGTQRITGVELKTTDTFV